MVRVTSSVYERQPADHDIDPPRYSAEPEPEPPRYTEEPEPEPDSKDGWMKKDDFK